jgi:hypothetical protein
VVTARKQALAKLAPPVLGWRYWRSSRAVRPPEDSMRHSFSRTNKGLK